MFVLQNVDREPVQAVFCEPAMSTDSEQRLLKRVADDQGAFWPLWQHHQPVVYRCCLKWTGNSQDAEDALSEVMLKARHLLPRHAGQIRNLEAWFAGLARNYCIDWQRQQMREATSRQKLEQEALFGGLDRPLLPLEVVESRETYESVRGAIATLPTVMREVAILRILEQKSTDESASYLNISPDLVRQRLRRARSLLQERLKPYLTAQKDEKAASFDQAAPPAACSPPAASLSFAQAASSARAASQAASYDQAASFDQVASFAKAASYDQAASQAASFAQTASFAKLPVEVPLVVPKAAPEISVEVVTIRLIPVTLPSGVEMFFHFPLRTKPARHAQKLSSLRQYVERHPTGWKKRLKLAQLLVASGDWEEAIEIYHLLVRQRAEIDIYLQLGQLLHVQGRNVEAIAVYEEANDVAQRESTRHHLRGLIATCRWQPKTASNAFEAAVSGEADNAAHWHALGLSRLSAGYPVEANHAFEQALQLNPDDLVALTHSCEALALEGKAKALEERARKALKLDPANILALKQLIDARTDQQLLSGSEGKETKRLIGRAQRIAPDAPDTHDSRAGYHISRSEPAIALNILRTFAEAHPKAPAAWYHYARRLSGTANQQAAINNILKAYALHPNDLAICRALCAILPATHPQRQEIAPRLSEYSCT